VNFERTEGTRRAAPASERSQLIDRVDRAKETNQKKINNNSKRKELKELGFAISIAPIN